MRTLPVVIVGASVAGVRVATSLRRHGFDHPVILLDREAGLPYDKPPLSKQVLTGAGQAVPLAGEEELRRLRLDYRPGTAATSLDASAKILSTSDPLIPEIRYDQLVLATGCVPRPLAHLDGTAHGKLLSTVHYLRTLADATRLRDALASAGRVVVIGAGLIGAEVAASARTLGCATTVVESADRMAARVLAPAPAARLLRLHNRNGVDVVLNTTVTGIADRGATAAVTLSDGRSLAADAVVIGVGATPDVTWLAGSGLCLGRERGAPDERYPDAAIYCDPWMRALGVRDVWAVGDAARWPHPHPQEDRPGGARYEHWTSAREQASRVAAAIAGHQVEPIAPVPFVWSDQYGVHIQHVGWTSADVRRRDAAGGVVFEFHQDGRIVGATGFGAQHAMMQIRREISSAAPVPLREARS